MAITVNTNVGSLQVQRNLNSATAGAQKAMQRMTTGLRINNAGDDAAGLVISKTLEAQQRGSEVAILNSQNGTNMLQVAEGYLDTMQSNLLRIRDLTLQAMNGGQGLAEVKGLESEAKLRVDEINRISNGAKYGEFLLFNKAINAGDTDDNMILQIGAGYEAATNTINIKGVFINSELSKLTAVSPAASGIQALTFTDASTTTGIAGRTDFETLLQQIDAGVKAISERRGVIGASQNRLAGTVEALGIQNENLSAANSRIKDADIAKESSEYTKYSILQQASAALLVQANQTPNIALTLI